MAYCRLSDDCDVYLYHDGEAFVFVSAGTTSKDVRCVGVSDALDQLVLMREGGRKVSLTAMSRLAGQMTTSGTTPSLASLDDGSLPLIEPTNEVKQTEHEDQWREILQKFGSFSPDVIEARVDAVLATLRPALEGLQDRSSIEELASWGPLFETLGLSMICVAPSSGKSIPHFVFRGTSRTLLEQHTLHSIETPDAVCEEGTSRKRL